MKTLEKIKVLSFEEKEKLEKEILKAISDNNLTKVKDILKYCPAEISCYGKNTVKYNEQETNDGSIIIGSPFLDPYSLILKAALTCSNNGNDFSILHYLFDEYGLSLKEPVSNFPFYEINRIIKADENIIIAKEGTEILLYSYLKEDNPSIEVIKFLVSKGARFDIYNDKYGNTILHNYVENNAYKRLEIAIKGGADVNMKAIGPWYDDTLLSYATSRSNDMYKTAKLLIELGADVNYLITPKHTILDLAYNSKNEKLLIDFGALTYQQLCEKNNIEFTKMSIEDLKCIAIHTRDSLAKKLNDIVKENNLEGVKEFLKDYPVPEVFFEK
ncbi:ankyrin repeat domain-containing protein, partial [uncultured Brachyspira sp.]|uniref:ankyrin repeat domain-containing protein n=1 Tax=uncultured Brachyspira sp. TaxID=221953 RepID=UPI00344C8399